MSRPEAEGERDAALRPLRREAGPLFAAPWEAQALAMAVRLQEAGHFTAKEWAQTLGNEIKRAQAAGDPDDGSTYYLHVLAALERLTTEKRLLGGDELTARKAAWTEAYASTPHGEPVSLDKTDTET